MKPGKDESYNTGFEMEHRPKLNFKNKSFGRWFRYAPFKHKDNLLSNEWVEKLENVPIFKPKYSRQEANMVYLMSGEYGRIWLKEREVWYSKINRKSEYELDMERRKKKLRKEFLEGKKQAEISIQQRKERRAKEAEAKAKAEAEAKEKAEKLKAKMEACLAAKRKPKKKVEFQKKENKQQDDCPPGYEKVELTVQCECSHDMHKSKESLKEQVEPKASKNAEDCDCLA